MIMVLANTDAYDYVCLDFKKKHCHTHIHAIKLKSITVIIHIPYMQN